MGGTIETENDASALLSNRASGGADVESESNKLLLCCLFKTNVLVLS